LCRRVFYLLPGSCDVALFRVGLAHAEAKSVFVIERRVGHVEVAAGIDPFKQPLIEQIASNVPEADKVQDQRRRKFERLFLLYPIGDGLRKFYVTPDVVAQALDSVVADDEPEFEGTKATAELNVPVAVVCDRTRFSGFVAQVLRQHTQGFDQDRSVGHEEAIAVKIGKHPLVRIETVAVSELDPRVYVSELRADGSRA
jgi:hypothetical protein